MDDEWGAVSDEKGVDLYCKWEGGKAKGEILSGESAGEWKARLL